MAAGKTKKSQAGGPMSGRISSSHASLTRRVKAHEKMDFHQGWGQRADRLAALVTKS